jgi:ABC-2 type transport system permease protein
MRLFSEERKGGTIELLLTSPLTTSQLVTAKYLGTVLIHFTMLALTFPYVVLLGHVGHPEWGPMATTYVGFFLFGAVLLAIGQFASAVTENQIIAIVITYAIFMPLMLVDLLLNFVGTQTADILAGVSVMVARRGLTHGVIDTHTLVLHACLIFLFLFLSVQVLESNRWR